MYSIAYRVSHVPSGVGAEIGIATALVTESADEVLMHLPATWSFPYVRDRILIPRRFGTSETSGIFGGRDHQQALDYSEACERALADVLTAIVCDIVDRNDEERLVVILGMAFPKIVGRLMSLRLPTRTTVGWYSPIPSPVWINGREEDPLLRGLGPTLSESWGDDEWEDERFVLAEQFACSDGTAHVVQVLRPGNATALASTIREGAWASSGSTGFSGPRAGVMAAEQLLIHHEERYSGAVGELLRIPEGVAPFYAALTGLESETWHIAWVEPGG